MGDSIAVNRCGCASGGGAAARFNALVVAKALRGADRAFAEFVARRLWPVGRIERHDDEAVAARRHKSGVVDQPSDSTRSRGHSVVRQTSRRPALGIGLGLRRTIGEAHGVIGCRNGCVVCLLFGGVRGAARKKRQRTGQSEREYRRSHHPPHCWAPLCPDITTSIDLKQGMLARSRRRNGPA